MAGKARALNSERPPAGASYDAIVVGAGPSGSSLSIRLALAGRRVLLLEKEHFPRDKVCGDFVSPRGLAVVAELGCLSEVLAASGTHIRSSFVHFGAERLAGASIPELPGLPDFGIALPRRIFDEILFRRAVRVGVETVEGAQVAGYGVAADGVTVTAKVAGVERAFRGHVVIGADGAQSVVARQAGLAPNDARYVVPTLRAYVTGLDFTRGHFFFDREFFPGFAWVFPIDSERANVGVGVPKALLKDAQLNIHRFFARVKARLEDEARKLGVAVSFTAERGFPIRLYSGPAAYSFERGILIGEAARLVDPISGEGIAQGLESAKIAADLLIERITRDDFSRASLSAYDDAIAARFGADLGMADLVVSAVRNRALTPLWIWAFRWMTSTARKDEAYASQMGGILAGLVPNWKALTPALLTPPLQHFPRFLEEQFGNIARDLPGGALRAGEALLDFQLGLSRAYATDPAVWQAWSKEMAQKQLATLGLLARRA
jgi:geranylgeranyl reductase family protein